MNLSEEAILKKFGNSRSESMHDITQEYNSSTLDSSRLIFIIGYDKKNLRKALNYFIR